MDKVSSIFRLYATPTNRTLKEFHESTSDHPFINKETLDLLEVGDLITFSESLNPYRVAGVSENFVLILPLFEGLRYYWVINKTQIGDDPRYKHRLIHDCYIYGKDDHFPMEHDFHDLVWIQHYLEEFESGKRHLSELRSWPLGWLHVNTSERHLFCNPMLQSELPESLKWICCNCLKSNCAQEEGENREVCPDMLRLVRKIEGLEEEVEDWSDSYYEATTKESY